MAEAGLEITNPATGEVLRFVETLASGSSRMVVEANSAPGMIGSPVHLHPHSDERFEGLDGVVMLEIDGVSRELRAGDRVTVSASPSHPVLSPVARRRGLKAVYAWGELG